MGLYIDISIKFISIIHLSNEIKRIQDENKNEIKKIQEENKNAIEAIQEQYRKEINQIKELLDKNNINNLLKIGKNFNKNIYF